MAAPQLGQVDGPWRLPVWTKTLTEALPSLAVSFMCWSKVPRKLSEIKLNQWWFKAVEPQGAQALPACTPGVVGTHT